MNERLAVVETRLEQIVSESEKHDEALNKLLDKMSKLESTVSDYNSTIIGYKSFIGGALFILSCFGAFLAKFGGQLWAALTGK